MCAKLAFIGFDEISISFFKSCLIECNLKLLVISYSVKYMFVSDVQNNEFVISWPLELLRKSVKRPVLNIKKLMLLCFSNRNEFGNSQTWLGLMRKSR